MSVIIRLQGLPLDANSVDVRLYFLGLTIPDGGVYIIGGEEGTVFIEFASDEDARQAMARGDGVIKNSNIKLLLSSRSEMQSVIDPIHHKYQTYQQPMQQMMAPWLNVALLPWAQPTQLPQAQPSLLHNNQKPFADKRCVLSASNIPYRATSKDIMDFLSDFNITEECIRRRYNSKGQPTADAKIAFPTHDAAMKALKIMNKKTICGRPVFLKPV